MRHALTALILGSLMSVASAAELVVPSVTHPTIASAISAATLGDVISVKPGTYAETLNLTNVTGLTILGKGKVVIDATGNSNGISGNTVTSTRIENVTVRNATGSGIDLSLATATILRKVRVENVGSDGIKLTGGLGNQLVSCSTKGCQEDGFDVETYSSLISGLVARDSQATGIAINGNINRVEKCTSENAVAVGFSLGASATSLTNVIVNLRIKGETATGVVATPNADHNSFFDVIISSATANGLSVNPGASRNSFRKITVGPCGAAAFVVDGSFNVFDTCSATKATNDGFNVTGFQNLLTNCSAKSCGTGFRVLGPSNAISRSKALKCALAATDVGMADNVYIENNFLDPNTI